VAGYRIVEIELVSLHQHHDPGRRKLFPQRSGLKNALSLRGHTVLDVGDAVPFGAQRYSIFDDRYGRAGYVLCRHFPAYKSIDLLVDAVGRRRYLSQNAERCQCCVQHRNLLFERGRQRSYRSRTTSFARSESGPHSRGGMRARRYDP
jgi:hypothetical protein